jgi:hypothetical protein
VDKHEPIFWPYDKETQLKPRRNLLLTWILAIVLGLALFAILTWSNYQYVKDNPGGNDFLVHWVGTRTLLTEGISPYGDETAERIQTLAYGRPALPGEHELRVAYPLYSIVVFFPFAMFKNYLLARALWMTTLEIGLVLLSVVCMRMADWKPGLLTLAMFLVFTVFWYHALRPLINGNAVILVALAVAGAVLALRSGGDELAGVLLAFSTIKPQVVVVLVLFLLYWGFKQKRWKFVGWFFGTLVLLSASAALLVPDWIWQNFVEVVRYPGYNPPGTPGSALATWMPGIGTRIGWAITGVMILLLLVEWFIAARRNEYRNLLWVVCLTMVAAQWVGIQTDPGNFIVTMPALVLIFAVFEERWRHAGRWMVLGSMVLLFASLWAIFLQTVSYGDQPVQSPIMFFPLPAFELVMLYWVRWWAIRPPSVWFDTVLSKESMSK